MPTDFMIFWVNFPFQLNIFFFYFPPTFSTKNIHEKCWNQPKFCTNIHKKFILSQKNLNVKKTETQLLYKKTEIFALQTFWVRVSQIPVEPPGVWKNSDLKFLQIKYVIFFIREYIYIFFFNILIFHTKNCVSCKIRFVVKIKRKMSINIYIYIFFSSFFSSFYSFKVVVKRNKTLVSFLNCHAL